MNTLISKGGPGHRVINPRAAFILAVVVGAGVFGMRRLHDAQFSATLQFLRDTAFKSLENKDFPAAQQQLTQYLAMKSGDREAREKLTTILSENIRTPKALEQAFRLNEELLRQGDADDTLRLRHARVAVQLGLMSDAEAHLRLLQGSQPDNAEVWYLSSVAAEATRDFKLTIACLQRSLRCSDRIPEAYAALARLATDSSAPEFQPDSLMKQLIECCPTAKAYRLRASYFMNAGQFAEAISDLWKALSESPDDTALNAMLVRCIQATETGVNEDDSVDDGLPTTIRRAIEHLRERVEKNPHNSNLRLCLAAVFWKAGERPGAIQILEEGIQQTPHEFTLHETLIEYLVSVNHVDKAQRILDSIPADRLSREARGFCSGRILMAEERWKEAAAAFEQSLAFGQKESGIFCRAQLSLAVCRSRSGDVGAALESFRGVVAENPDSIAARLGMASAWVSAGQLDLAVAEYRQMQDVPGVSAYLADLLIQKNLRQPTSLRSWNEVDSLLREDNPAIPDPVQRILLRTDRLFAAGEILQAVCTLENAALRHSDRSEIRSALRRLHGEYAPGLRDRLTQLVAEEPENPEVHAALVRQFLAAGDSRKALAALEELSQSQSAATSSREHSLLLTVETITGIIEMERRIQRTIFIADLENAAAVYSRRLASLNPDHERQLMRTLVRSGKADDAIRFVRETPEKNRPEARAVALVEIVRSSSNRETLLATITAELYAMIGRHPQNPELRYLYADLMLYAREYKLADQILAPLSSLTYDGRISARRAWILAVEERDLSEATELAANAIQANSQQPLFREVQSRVCLARKEFEEALKVLQTIPRESLSLAGQTYLAATLLKLDRMPEAQAAFDNRHASNDADSLFPADEDLLQSIAAQLLPPATARR